MWKGSFPHCTSHFFKRVTGKHFPPASFYLMLCFQKGRGWGKAVLNACEGSLLMRPVTIIQTTVPPPALSTLLQFKINKQSVWTVGKRGSRSWNSTKSCMSKEKQWSKWLLPFLTSFCSLSLQVLLIQTQIPNTHTALRRTLVHTSCHERIPIWNAIIPGKWEQKKRRFSEKVLTWTMPGNAATFPICFIAGKKPPAPEKDFFKKVIW